MSYKSSSVYEIGNSPKERNLVSNLIESWSEAATEVIP